jgi:hypothetical protein
MEFKDIPYVSMDSKEIPYVSMESKEIPYVSMDSKEITYVSMESKEIRYLSDFPIYYTPSNEVLGTYWFHHVRPSMSYDNLNCVC